MHGDVAILLSSDDVSVSYISLVPQDRKLILDVDGVVDTTSPYKSNCQVAINMSLLTVKFDHGSTYHLSFTFKQVSHKSLLSLYGLGCHDSGVLRYDWHVVIEHAQ